MKTNISELAHAARSLMGLGYTKRAAIKFVATGERNRLKKSAELGIDDEPLPVPDTRESDQRRKDREAKERQNAASKESTITAANKYINLA